jgi:YYY domain-containing protein
MIDFAAALRWWIGLTLLGALAWPLAYTLLRRLPDRGFAFLRPIGLLLGAYVYWLAGTLGFTGNHSGGLALALLALGGLSWVVYRRRPADDRPVRDWLRANWKAALAIELFFAATFALWVWARAQNPSITATEKPMELAFLNAVGLSPSFPPLDPWLSGYAISYYYFGYVMVSLLTSFLADFTLLPEAYSYNLAVAWLFAATATGALGVVANLVALRRERQEDHRPQTTDHGQKMDSEELSSVVRRPWSTITGRALAWGVVAGLAVALAGNMQVGLELLHGSGVGPDGLWAWLDVRDISGPAEATEPARYETANWWWWRTSRVIHEYTLSGRAEEGLEPIVEIPAFSFVLGDLHPHVLALPFAFLAMAVALTWYLELRVTSDELRVQSRSSLVTRRSSLVTRLGVPWPLWLFTAVVLGGLSFLNTWDVGIYLFVVLGAYFLAHWAREGHTRGLWGRTALMALALVGAAVVLYLPFYLGFRSQAGPPFLLPMLVRPTRLAHYLIIFGLPLSAITIFLLALAARSRFRQWRAGLGAALVVVAGLLLVMLLFVFILAAGPESGRIAGLASELGLALPPRPEGGVAVGWGFRTLVALLPAVLGARLAWPWLTLFLAGLLALVVMALRDWAGAPATGDEERGARAWREPALPFILLLILTGILLTLGPEFLYLRDNFGVRLNTTFKFYYQAWAMFGAAAVAALDYLWATRRGAAGRVAAYGATAVYVALLAVALLFPALAVRSRSIEYRGPAVSAGGQPLERQPATLDGLAYLRRFNPAEYEALLWLREAAEAGDGPPPVVLEAVGGQYSGYGRVSAITGLPTLLGWPGHEWQWRGGDHPEPGRREPIVRQIYETPDLSAVSFLLDQFDVAYIFVGDLEREQYGAGGLDKFSEELEIAFANDRVTIYRWQPGGGS